MHINELLKLKLKEDLIKALKNKYNDTIDLSSEKYTEICNQKINSKIKNLSFLKKKISENENTPESNKCCARIWNNHYGTRCNYKTHKGDYCKHHLNMIKKNGKLIFNRYDEDRPIYNEKNNKIPWIDIHEIDVVNNILIKQWISLETKININLKKQRYIAPKI